MKEASPAADLPFFSPLSFFDEAAVAGLGGPFSLGLPPPLSAFLSLSFVSFAMAQPPVPSAAPLFATRVFLPSSPTLTLTRVGFFVSGSIGMTLEA